MMVRAAWPPGGGTLPRGGVTVKARRPMPSPATFRPSRPLTGQVRVPGDKSISHRSLMLSALAVGRSTIRGLSDGEDVLATAVALRSMGATIERARGGEWMVDGVGVGGLLQPEAALDMGNSGTSARLLMGMIASHPITATLVGDASLCSRPMARVTEPLGLMGAEFTADRLPLTLRGLCPAVPLTYRLPVASAQVKSAVLLAGLNTPGVTRVEEPVPSRDHTERMLAAFDAHVRVEQVGGIRQIAVTGEAELSPQSLTVPGDISSAAFLVVAALIVPGSDLVIEGVGLNPTRTGLLTVLRAMGGSIDELEPRTVGGEPAADLRVRHSALIGVEVDPALAPSMIDEFPALFVAAALAEGTTTTTGLGELRLKESDRLATMAGGLKAVGVEVEERPDGLLVQGSGGAPLPGGGPVRTQLDHRVAMSFAVAGLASREGVFLDDMAPVATSFPGFRQVLESVAP